MKIEFKKSFLKELSKLNQKHLKVSIIECIEQVESAESISKIKNLKKLKGYNNYYRLRVGDYRIGIKVENEIIYFVVFEHRKDIYKGFP
ncbi:MAG: type II toxin-antitoxin system RelE/ParE family toxin [Chitinophagaceae bacterium]|nr:type II toxin-antitoxin system RelE/ParE family toxin [Chitinophagaceae bacterium]